MLREGLKQKDTVNSGTGRHTQPRIGTGNTLYGKYSDKEHHRHHHHHQQQQQQQHSRTASVHHSDHINDRLPSSDKNKMRMSAPSVPTAAPPNRHYKDLRSSLRKVENTSIFLKGMKAVPGVNWEGLQAFAATEHVTIDTCKRAVVVVTATASRIDLVHINLNDFRRPRLHTSVRTSSRNTAA